MIPWRFILVGLPLILLAPVHAEILVYKSSVNRWSSTLIQNGTKSAWVTAPRGSKMDAYSLYYLDGTSRCIPAPMMTYRGETFKPEVIYVDHKLKTKQITGATPANEADNTTQAFYGRSRGPGGQRIFRILYQQWEPNPDGSYDTGVSVYDGTCKILNIGGGKTAITPPKSPDKDGVWTVGSTGPQALTKMDYN